MRNTLKIVLVVGVILAAIGGKANFAYAAVSYGQTIPDSISVAAEKDEFVFSAVSGDVVYLPFAKKDTNSLSLYVELFDPQGTRVAYSTSGLLTKALTATGDFKITVRDSSNTNTGTYEFTLQRTNNPAGATAISFGQTVSGTIDSLTDVAAYTFSANANDKLYIPFCELSQASGNFAPNLKLYDPSGTLITSQTDGLLTATAASTGTYYILVAANSRNGIGTYEFSLQRSNNPAGATAISFGQSLSGAIGRLTKISAYSFSANANDKLYIPFCELSQTSGNFAPNFKLYDPSGTLVASENDELLTATAASAGTYYILVAANSRDGTGTYEFTLQRTNDPIDTKESVYNSITEDSIDILTGINVYRFTANINDSITICSAVESETSGNFYCYLQLYDTSGARLVSGSGSLKHTFNAGGTFYLFITASSRDGTGLYKFILLNGSVSCGTIDLRNPEVLLISPQAGEIIESGSTYKISWESSDDIGIVSQEIQLSLDSGATYPTVIASGLTADIQVYDWVIPAELSTNRARIKIIARDARGNTGEGLVNGDIAIIKTLLPAEALTIDYGYDKNNRLINSTVTFAKYSYNYDALGNRLSLVTGNLSGDTTPPTTPVVADEGKFSVSNSRLSASWSSSDPESGIVEYQYSIGIKPGAVDVAGWTSSGMNASVTLTGLKLINGRQYYFAVKAKNSEGLWSPVGYSDGITVDASGPFGRVKINNDAKETSNRNVTLRLYAVDKISGMGADSQMQFSNDGKTWSAPEAYGLTKSWQLLSGQGQRTVYAKFKDTAGNWSMPYSDLIILKANRPPKARISAYPSAGRTPLSVGFSASGSSDPDGRIISYLWNFGDRTTSTFASPRHIFVNTSGTACYFTVTLTVKDDNGAGSSSKTTIVVYPKRRTFGWW